ncbi:hypothetical protein GYH30_009780 [Glycine max]|nr:hypothetical protein GYH30_009780 [Glycine max]
MKSNSASATIHLVKWVSGRVASWSSLKFVNILDLCLDGVDDVVALHLDGGTVAKRASEVA